MYVCITDDTRKQSYQFMHTQTDYRSSSATLSIPIAGAAEDACCGEGGMPGVDGYCE